MTRDISLQESSIWAARTIAGMLFVRVEAPVVERIAGGDLIALRSDAGDVVAARMIGPVDDGSTEGELWEIDRRLRIDTAGMPLAVAAPGTEPGPGIVTGHDWGALGLPDGLDTRVTTVDDPDEIGDDLALARASDGHRMLEHNPLLTMTPGDRVIVDGQSGVVAFIDRRKRTVEIDRRGERSTWTFDDVQLEEMS